MLRFIGFLESVFYGGEAVIDFPVSAFYGGEAVIDFPVSAKILIFLRYRGCIFADNMIY